MTEISYVDMAQHVAIQGRAGSRLRLVSYIVTLRYATVWVVLSLFLIGAYFVAAIGWHSDQHWLVWLALIAVSRSTYWRL